MQLVKAEFLLSQLYFSFRVSAFPISSAHPSHAYFIFLTAPEALAAPVGPTQPSVEQQPWLFLLVLLLPARTCTSLSSGSAAIAHPIWRQGRLQGIWRKKLCAEEHRPGEIKHGNVTAFVSLPRFSVSFYCHLCDFHFLTQAVKCWQRSNSVGGKSCEPGQKYLPCFSLLFLAQRITAQTIFCQSPYVVLYNRGKLPFFFMYSACVNTQDMT